MDTCILFRTCYRNHIFWRLTSGVRSMMHQKGFSVIDYIDVMLASASEHWVGVMHHGPDRSHHQTQETGSSFHASDVLGGLGRSYSGNNCDT